MTDQTPPIEELLAPTELPRDHDPLADGILMKHQREWLEDKSPLKLCAKGRRTGITYAEALDDTITAASARSADGDNVFYIGDTKEKGLEFIHYVAHFARVVAKELHEVEEFLFEDKRDDGDSKFIAAYRVRFASGFAVVALSSRPANIRGLQGIVVIDEAAFHPDVEAVLDAVNALLIWGGKIRIISSHNGQDNAFARLIEDTRKGDYDYSIHTIPFSEAVKNGLYERVCLMRGWTSTRESKAKWVKDIQRSYGSRTEARDEELEAIPRRSSGAYIPRALVQHAQDEGVPILHWAKPENWYLDPTRLETAKEWVRDVLEPALELLDQRRHTTFGQDFGRNGDLSVIALSQEERPAQWRAALQIELRRIPFDVQQYVLWAVIEHLPRFVRGALDARGNGQSHAEAAQQKFGPERIICVAATAKWYAEWFPQYRAALEDRSYTLPGGQDVIADHRLAELVHGNPTVSEKHVKGEDGEERHGDSLVAHLLCLFATHGAPEVYAYEGGIRRRNEGITGTGWRDRAPENWPEDERNPNRGLLPAMRGGIL